MLRYFLRLAHFTKLFFEICREGTRNPPYIATVHESGRWLMDFDLRAIRSSIINSIVSLKPGAPPGGCPVDDSTRAIGARFPSRVRCVPPERRTPQGTKKSWKCAPGPGGVCLYGP